MVAEDKRNNEESDSEEDSDAGDEVDEVVDLFGDGSLAGVQAGRQPCDTAHDLTKVITSFRVDRR